MRKISDNLKEIDFNFCKIYRWAGTSLWNNLLQPEGTKSSNWASPQKKFLCPTEEHPYIYTYDNDNSVI